MSIQSTTSASSASMLTQVATGQAAPKVAQDAARAANASVRSEPTKKVDLGHDPGKERAQLQQAIDQLNDQMKDKNRDLSFSLDERINRTIITVKKLETGEVVRQIPSEELVRLAHSLEDAKGLLFNQES